MCLLGSVLGLASCNSNDPKDSVGGSEPVSVVTPEPGSSNVGGSDASDTPSEQSPIKSLTAVEENVVMRLSEKISAENYYELKGYGSLTNATKKVTVTSSDDSVVEFKSKKLVAKGLGQATITVTSSVDDTKTCSFNVEVKDIFFNRDYSNFVNGDDTTRELPDEGGIIAIAPDGKNYSQGDYVINGINSTKWMTEVTIELKSVLGSEHFPKIGIFTTSTEEAEDGISNQVNFFLDGYIGDGEPNWHWSNFGVCEVYSKGGWAWNPGVTNAQARHADGAYNLGASYLTCQSYKDNHPEETADTSFKMKLARDGYNFHLWVNDNYAFSMKVLEYLFTDTAGNPCKSMPGFFQFNSGVVFSNYSATDDVEAVNAAIEGIGESLNMLTDSQYAAD